MNKCLNLLTDTGYAIFILTDRRCGGTIPKHYYCIDEAYKLGFTLVAHKISYEKIETIDLYKPTFSHLLIFTKKGKIRCNIPDIFDGGEKSYCNANGYRCIEYAVDFLAKYNIVDVIDPFVGEGTTLKIAKTRNFKRCVGIDIDKRQTQKIKSKIL